MWYRNYGKRLFDISFSVAALAILSPVLLVVAIAIHIEDRGPILFKQARVGQHGLLFSFIKFRSMPVRSDDIPSALAGSMSITRIGKIIRRTNIDELPQIFNILKGDMSLVGPRPALNIQKRLCALRKQLGVDCCLPGLTGLAQINSYDNMPDAEKAKWDSLYCNNVSFRNDVAIIFRTFSYLQKPPPVY